MFGGIVPIADKGATWDVFVAWQRGKVAAPVRALIDALDLRSSSPDQTDGLNVSKKTRS
jgi:hypothetical protein